MFTNEWIATQKLLLLDYRPFIIRMITLLVKESIILPSHSVFVSACLEKRGEAYINSKHHQQHAYHYSIIFTYHINPLYSQ